MSIVTTSMVTSHVMTTDLSAQSNSRPPSLPNQLASETGNYLDPAVLETGRMDHSFHVGTVNWMCFYQIF